MQVAFLPDTLCLTLAFHWFVTLLLLLLLLLL